jgi:hypothetical protein
MTKFEALSEGPHGMRGDRPQRERPQKSESK